MNMNLSPRKGDIEVVTSSWERRVKRLLPAGIKNIFLKFLVNSLFGKFLKISRIEKNLFGGLFDYSLVSDRDAAKIFWGVWESAEIRFAKRFVNTSVVIELGSSVGVTLGVLSAVRANTSFIGVEASIENFEKLRKLSERFPKGNNYALINKAIAYGTERVTFNFTTATGSKIDHNINDPSKYVEATTLSKIIEEHNVNSGYSLLADIEGAEADVFFEDEEALGHCRLIIAELENTNRYSIDDQIERLCRLGFALEERYGRVVVMARRESVKHTA